MKKNIKNNNNFFEKHSGFWGFLGVFVTIIIAILGRTIFSNNSKIITELYDDIIIDYEGASLGKIKNDFGIPYNSNEEIGEKGDKINTYYYKLKNGNIIFDSNGKIRVELNNNYDYNILIPAFYNRGNGYKNIILGKSNFSDYCLNYDFNKIETRYGTLNSSKFTELEIDLGNFTQYRIIKLGTYYTNGESELLDESNSTIEQRKNKCMILKNQKFDYIEIN